MSSETPWEAEGRYFTSPWNHLDSVREGLDFPSRVKFHDVSLRDGKQQAGIAFAPADKLAIATAWPPPASTGSRRGCRSPRPRTRPR